MLLRNTRLGIKMKQFIINNTEHFIMIATFIGILWAMLKFLLRDVSQEIASLKKDFERMDRKYDKMELKHDKMEQRLDHLYHICIEMLKTRRP